MRKSTLKKKKLYHEIRVKSSPSLALIKIDQRPIRKKHIQSCKKAIKDLNKARGELFVFESQDLPKYNTWYNRTFQSEISEVKEAHDKAGEAYMLIKDIEFIKTKLRVSNYEAYKIALDRKKNPQKYEHLFRDKQSHDDFFDDEEDFEEEFFQKEEDMFNEDQIEFLFKDFINQNPDIRKAVENKKVYDFLFEKFKEKFQGEKRNYTYDEEKKPESKTSDKSLVEQVKALYRTLARKLHPDYRKSSEDHYNELWFQVQEAYKTSNLEKLEILNSQFNAYEGNFGDEFSIFQIISARESYKLQLKSVRSKIRSAKKDIAWGFSKVSQRDTHSMKEKIKRQFKEEISEHNQNFKYFNQILKEWSMPPVRSKKSKKKADFEEDDFLTHIF